MKMKRAVCLVLACSLLSVQLTASAGFWDDLGSAISDAAESVEDALKEAAEDAGELWDAAKGKLGDVASALKDNLSRIWNETGVRLSEIWADGSEVWDWTRQKGAELWTAAVEAIGNAGDWISENGTGALTKLQELWNSTLESLNVTKEDAEQLWNGMQQFAKEHNISAENAVKVMIPVLSTYLAALQEGTESVATVLQKVEEVLVDNNLVTDDAISDALQVIQKQLQEQSGTK